MEPLNVNMDDIDSQEVINAIKVMEKQQSTGT
jgi:hypothetical protein